MTHPKCAEAAVVGVEHPIKGQVDLLQQDDCTGCHCEPTALHQGTASCSQHLQMTATGGTLLLL